MKNMRMRDIYRRYNHKYTTDTKNITQPVKINIHIIVFNIDILSHPFIIYCGQFAIEKIKGHAKYTYPNV